MRNRNTQITVEKLKNIYAGVKVVFEKASDMERKGYNLMSHSDLDTEKLERLGWSAVFNLDDVERDEKL